MVELYVICVRARFPRDPRTGVTGVGVEVTSLEPLVLVDASLATAEGTVEPPVPLEPPPRSLPATKFNGDGNPVESATIVKAS